MIKEPLTDTQVQAFTELMDMDKKYPVLVYRRQDGQMWPIADVITGTDKMPDAGHAQKGLNRLLSLLADNEEYLLSPRRLMWVRRAIDLSLTAGADPMYVAPGSPDCTQSESILTRFVMHKNYYGAMAVLKSPKLTGEKQPTRLWRLLSRQPLKPDMLGLCKVLLKKKILPNRQYGIPPKIAIAIIRSDRLFLRQERIQLPVFLQRKAMIEGKHHERIRT